ncbi:uncharacterized protein LOC62_03G004122 [Vanrija pseudolonga]|uniref:Uncharacterized protein n=1 Tax=Vanrija pseudolonga TaxID=143232 RepID=A0AAF0Y747_9TREE|nr:hypothetical protein LOC62_03G004122 [Vanrija pseudolonga]
MSTVAVPLASVLMLPRSPTWRTLASGAPTCTTSTTTRTAAATLRSCQANNAYQAPGQERGAHDYTPAGRVQPGIPDNACLDDREGWAIDDGITWVGMLETGWKEAALVLREVDHAGDAAGAGEDGDGLGGSVSAPTHMDRVGPVSVLGDGEGREGGGSSDDLGEEHGSAG